MRLRTSLVIPTLNEAESIATVVAEIPRGLISEIIIADGGSTDDTRERAAQAGARIVTSGRGYGRACLAGAMAAQGNNNSQGNTSNSGNNNSKTTNTSTANSNNKTSVANTANSNNKVSVANGGTVNYNTTTTGLTGADLGTLGATLGQIAAGNGGGSTINNTPPPSLPGTLVAAPVSKWVVWGGLCLLGLAGVWFFFFREKSK